MSRTFQEINKEDITTNPTKDRGECMATTKTNLALLNTFFGILVKCLPDIPNDVYLELFRRKSEWARFRAYLRKTFEVPGRAPDFFTRTSLQVPLGGEDGTSLLDEFPVLRQCSNVETLLKREKRSGVADLVGIPESNMWPGGTVPFMEALKFYTSPEMGFKRVPFAVSFAVFRDFPIKKRLSKKYKGKSLYFGFCIFPRMSCSEKGVIRISIDQSGGMVLDIVPLDGLRLGKDDFLILMKSQLRKAVESG